MNLNQFTTDELATLAAWTDQLALAADLEGGYNPLNAPRLGGLAKFFCDFLLKSGAVGLPVINKTGGSLAVNKAVYISGYDTVSGCFKVALAAPTTTKAVGVLEAALADGATGTLRSNFLLANSGLDTSGATLGDPVYLAASGALSLTASSADGAFTQVVGYVQTLVNTVAPNAGGTIRIAPQPTAPTATRVEVTVSAATGIYSAAAPAGWSNGDALVGTYGGDATNNVYLLFCKVSAGNLVVKISGDPGATPATVHVVRVQALPLAA
jgi:hypothetical protein